MLNLMLPLVAAIGLVGQPPAAAESAAAAKTPPTPAEIAAAVERLGSNRFAEREAATELLWQAGRAAQPALEAAALDKDAERARRAKGLLEKVRWGILPDTPPEVIAEINSYRNGHFTIRQQALRRLRDLRRYDVIVDLLQTGPQDQQSKQLAAEFAQEIRVAAFEALLAGEVDRADLMLKRLMRLQNNPQGVRDYAAFLLLTGKGPAAEARLRDEMQLQPGGESARVLAYLLIMQDRLAEARAAAEQVVDESLQTELALRLQDWKALAQKYPLPDGPNVEQLAYCLTFARLTNDDERERQAVTQLRDLAREPQQTWQAVEALLLNERWQDADEAAAAMPKIQLELLCDQMRYREGLALVAPGEPRQPGWSAKWFAREAEKRADQKEAAAAHDRFAVTVARALYQSGDRDEANRLFDAVAAVVEKTNGRQVLLEAELRYGRRARAEQRAVELASRDETRLTVMYAFYKTKGVTADKWWGYLRRHFPQDDAAATWGRLQKLMAPGEGSPFDDATLAELAKTAESAIDLLRPAEQTTELGRVVEVLQARGDLPLAQQYLEKIPVMNPAVPVSSSTQRADYVHPAAALRIRLGDLLRLQKNWVRAAQAYDEAWNFGKSQALPLYLKGYCLERAGQAERGRELMRQADLLPLAGATQRRALAAGLLERDLKDEAREQRRKLWQYALRSSWDFDVLNTAETEGKQLGRDGIVEAEPMWSYLQLCLLRSSTSMSELIGYRELPQAIHRGRAWRALESKQWDEARRELDAGWAAQPGYADYTELAVQKLDALDRRADADALFSKTFDYFGEVCRDFPNSAWHFNAAAWLATQCDRRLDEAQTLAERAVKLQPETAAYIDTLAEVHFRRGDFAKAVELERKAIGLLPDDAEIAAQLKKFEAAAANPQ